MENETKLFITRGETTFKAQKGERRYVTSRVNKYGVRSTWFDNSSQACYGVWIIIVRLIIISDPLRREREIFRALVIKRNYTAYIPYGL